VPKRTSWVLEKLIFEYVQIEISYFRINRSEFFFDNLDMITDYQSFITNYFSNNLFK
jgi:hypothetical protein